MNRRELLQSLTLLSAGLLIPPKKIFADSPGSENEIKIIKPKPLKPGSTIGLISPAGFISEEELEESIGSLEKLGYKVKYTDNVIERFGYLGGTDQQRSDDVNYMFSNSEIDGIVCTRGGYGVARILPMLDYEVIKKNPKVLIGYSDITALLYGIFSQTGLICFHGPVGISTFDDFSVESMMHLLTNTKEDFNFNFSYDKDLSEQDSVYEIRGGKAKGMLAGGNLSIMASLAGSKYNVDLADKIVFIEEVREDPYRIDRMLTQLIQSSNLDKAAGIMLGVFNKCDIRIRENQTPKSFTLSEVLFDRLSDLNIPVVYGIPFGHIAEKITIPFGGTAFFDAENGELSFAPAVAE